jgi:hypothetical protein
MKTFDLNKIILDKFILFINIFHKKNGKNI